MIKTFIFAEDGSVDLDELKSSVGDDVLVISYRQGATPPAIQQPREPVSRREVNIKDRLLDLMIEFDEMGFAPTTICPNPEQYATEWRERVRKEFARLTAENDNLTVELEVAQRDVENLTRTLDESNDEIKALESENAELRATLSKMETVEKELRERLDKAVELPYTEKGKEYTKIVYKNEFGDIDDETYFHDCYYGYKNDMRGDKYAEARLTELKGGRE